MNNIIAFIDSILERRKNNRFASFAEEEFIESVSPFMELSPNIILSNIPFKPEKIIFLFRYWRSGAVYALKSTGKTGVFELFDETNGYRMVIWMENSNDRIDIYHKINNFGWNLSYSIPLPTNIYEFILMCEELKVELSFKDFPYQKN